MTKSKTINLGFEIKMPKEKILELVKELKEAKLRLRGRMFNGKIISKDTHRSAVITWDRVIYVPKYERYMKKRSKIKVHNPSCINAQIGDFVKVVETRPMSKTKSFVIVEITK